MKESMTSEERKRLDVRQSTLITAMRFPLIVLVLYEHSVGAYMGISTTYGVVSEMISHHLCPLAVCWFFFLSGYLFFLNTGDGNGFSIQWFFKKWKRRIWTILIPYLIWNLIQVIAIILKNYGFSLIGIPIDSDELSVVKQGILYWFITGPADFPLWFLRDIMVMSLISPFLYPLYKRIPWISLLLLILIYLNPWSFQFLSTRAVFYFSIGAWMSINRYSFLFMGRRIKISAAIISVFLLLLATASIEKPWHEWLRYVFYPFGMITFMNICDWLINKEQRKERLIRLSAPVFFIYAAHEIYILGWTKGLFVRIFGEGVVGIWIKFIFVPIVVLCICLALFWLLNHIMPKILAFCCGGRTIKNDMKL